MKMPRLNQIQLDHNPYQIGIKSIQMNPRQTKTNDLSNGENEKIISLVELHLES